MQYRVIGFTCHRDILAARCEKGSIGGESRNVNSNSNIYLFNALIAKLYTHTEKYHSLAIKKVII